MNWWYPSWQNPFMETWQGTDYPSGKSTVAMESSLFFSIREIHLQRVHFPSSYVRLLECLCHVVSSSPMIELEICGGCVDRSKALSNGTGWHVASSHLTILKICQKWDHLFPINLQGSLYNYQPKHCTYWCEIPQDYHTYPYICIKFEFPKKWVPLKFPLFCPHHEGDGQHPFGQTPGRWNRGIFKEIKPR